MFAIKFDRKDTIDWLRISAMTLALSLTLMSFVKIFLVWVLPQTYLGLAMIILAVGFIVVVSGCEFVVENSFGTTAKVICL